MRTQVKIESFYEFRHRPKPNRSTLGKLTVCPTGFRDLIFINEHRLTAAMLKRSFHEPTLVDKLAAQAYYSFLHQIQLFDFKSGTGFFASLSNLRDFHKSHIVGAIGEGLLDLYLDASGFAWKSNYSAPGKAPDFVYTDNRGQSILAEAKGTAGTNPKKSLSYACREQLYPVLKDVGLRKGVATCTQIREHNDTTLHVAFVENSSSPSRRRMQDDARISVSAAIRTMGIPPEELRPSPEEDMSQLVTHEGAARFPVGLGRFQRTEFDGRTWYVGRAVYPTTTGTGRFWYDASLFELGVRWIFAEQEIEPNVRPAFAAQEALVNKTYFVNETPSLPKGISEITPFSDGSMFVNYEPNE